MTPAQEAAFRLLNSLPVRVHYAKSPDKTVPFYPNKSRPARHPGSGRGGSNRICIDYNGERFNSIREMAAALHVSNKTIYRLLDTGEAVRA